MRILDISVPLRSAMPIYPGDAPFRREEIRSLRAGDELTLSRLELGSHTGTHVDAPSHFLPGGPTLDEVPLDAFIGAARVLDLRAVERAIGAEDLRPHHLRPGERVLLKTRNSELWRRPAFDPGFVHLTEEAARLLVAQRVRSVGIDYLSVEGFGTKGAPVHRALLGAGIGIIEGLDLSRVEPGADYQLYCLPLRVEGTEGSPARAILLAP